MDVLSRVAKLQGCFVQGGKIAWVFCPGWQNCMGVLSRVVNMCWMFCPGWPKMAWDVLSKCVLYIWNSLAIVQQMYNMGATLIT